MNDLMLTCMLGFPMFAMVVFLVECFHNGDSSFLWKQH